MNTEHIDYVDDDEMEHIGCVNDDEMELSQPGELRKDEKILVLSHEQGKLSFEDFRVFLTGTVLYKVNYDLVLPRGIEFDGQVTEEEQRLQGSADEAYIEEYHLSGYGPEIRLGSSCLVFFNKDLRIESIHSTNR
ncbi:hypothetical protein [Shimazuella kribbensis]|uniref:hypothetical protein n=1 Tax=Shimazuella kribbensis TaxID=139808 RepID=UPI00048F79FA|nr:hypothetical protein [Shimazuella kribbensis]